VPLDPGIGSLRRTVRRATAGRATYKGRAFHGRRRSLARSGSSITRITPALLKPATSVRKRPISS